MSDEGEELGAFMEIESVDPFEVSGAATPARPAFQFQEDLSGQEDTGQQRQARSLLGVGLSAYSEVMTIPEVRQELLELFLESQHVKSLRDWQEAYVSRPFSKQTGVILQLPPGAGKTLIAQWVILESLCFFPTKRVMFAVPLRVLATQVCSDIARVLDIFNDFLKRHGLELPGHRGDKEEFQRGFKVALAEGPGAVIDLNAANVVVATYEHAAGELRNDPKAVKGGEIPIHIGLVIVDEVHNIAKQDRGMVIDDVFYFTNLRNKLSSSKVNRKTHPFIFNEFERDDNVYAMPQVIGMSGTLEDWVSKRLVSAYGARLVRDILTPDQLAPLGQGLQAQLSALDKEAAARPAATGTTGNEPQGQQRRGPPRLILPANKFTVAATADLALDIIRGLVKRRLEHPEERPRRLVVFMSCVVEAEMAFIHVYRDHDLREMLAELSKRTRKVVETTEVEQETPTGEVVLVQQQQEVLKPYFACPEIELVNNLQSLEKKYGKEGFGFKGECPPGHGRKKVREFAKNLEAGGIYIHHAQITASIANIKPGALIPSWSDIVQEQLSTDFIAVFSTSTISVGVNLASTQIGILGPNTMWTVDQAEQMIGRVGRVNEDAANSFVAVVDSTLYHAPMAVSIAVPDPWFIPRFTSAVEFSRAWAVRKAEDRLKKITEHNEAELSQIQEISEVGLEALALDASVQSATISENITEEIPDDFGFDLEFVDTDQNKDDDSQGIYVQLHENLDVRGFFSPGNTATLVNADIPGNGVANLALVWKLVDERIQITPQTKAALVFCKQDQKCIPAMRYVLDSLFSEGKRPNPESWRIFFLWALLMVRFPPKWNQWFPLKEDVELDENTKAVGLKVFTEFHFNNQFPKLFPASTETISVKEFEESNSNAAQLSEVVDGMLRLYGESHVSYLGQPDIPGETNTHSVRAFADFVAWCGSLLSYKWPTESPLDLFTYYQDNLFKFLITIDSLNLEDLALQRLNIIAIKEAVSKAMDFVAACLFPYAAARRDLQPEVNFANLPPGTNSAVGFLVPATTASRDAFYALTLSLRAHQIQALHNSLLSMQFKDSTILRAMKAEFQKVSRELAIQTAQERAKTVPVSQQAAPALQRQVLRPT